MELENCFVVYMAAPHLLGGVLQVGNEITALVGLLQTGEDHLGAGDVLLRVLQVLEERFFAPCDACAEWRISNLAVSYESEWILLMVFSLPLALLASV